MALGLGFGLPFTAGRGVPIPQAQALLWWLDPRRIAASPVDSWASRRGSFAPAAAGGARPTWDGTSVNFDGTDDALTATAGPGTNPDGAGKFTLACWANPDSVAASAVVLETADYPNSILLLSAPTYIDVFVGSLSCRFPTAMTAGSWGFYAIAYDGSRALGSRGRLYRGEPTVVEEVPSADNVNVTTVPTATGTARVGGRSTVFFDGKIGDAFLWSGVELSAQELQQVVNATNY